MKGKLNSIYSLHIYLYSTFHNTHNLKAALQKMLFSKYTLFHKLE